MGFVEMLFKWHGFSYTDFKGGHVADVLGWGAQAASAPTHLLDNPGADHVSRLANWALITYKDLMETILDHNPTPFELHQLGYTYDITPLTDELRAEILASDCDDPLVISNLMAMRGDDARARHYLEMLPADDWRRRATEELNGEWSILKH